MMTRKRRRWGRLFLVLISVALVVPVAAGSLSRALAQAGGGSEDSIYRHLSVLTEVLSLIQRGYVDDTSMRELFAGAFDGLSDGLDPLATFVPGPEVETFRTAMGVGAAHSGLRVVRSAGIPYVLAVEDGSPAAVAGIERGDILAEVDDLSTRTMALWELEVRLAASSGQANLKLLRRGETITVELPLGPFPRSEPLLSRYRDVPVLRLSRVGDGPASSVAGIVAESLAGERRLVVDLRGVAGDDFEAAYEVGALFATGTLGELLRRDERLETFAAGDAPAWSGELAVLINSGTQGVGEVLARILEQGAGARLVGERSFGHAGRRIGMALDSGDVLFLSDAFYTGPDGEPIRDGLEPAERVLGRRGAGAEGDPALDKAVDLLTPEAERQAA